MSRQFKSNTRKATSINTCNVTIRKSRKSIAINSTFRNCKHKGRPRKSKKTTANATYCYQTCKARHRFIGQMTRCCMCMIWFHNKCIDEISDEEKSTAVWLCKVCRENPKLIQTLLDRVGNIESLVEEHTSLLLEVRDAELAHKRAS